jgi:hypothetical protein
LIDRECDDEFNELSVGYFLGALKKSMSFFEPTIMAMRTRSFLSFAVEEGRGFAAPATKSRVLTD